MLWITARTKLKRASLRVQENADEVRLPFSIPYEQVGCADAYVRGQNVALQGENHAWVETQSCPQLNLRCMRRTITASGHNTES